MNGSITTTGEARPTILNHADLAEMHVSAALPCCGLGVGGVLHKMDDKE